METVVFFASATRHSCRKRVAGVQRYFASSDIQVVVVESNYSHINVKKVLDFWHPVGCIAECGSDMDEYRPDIFGNIPTVYLDRDPALRQKIKFSVNADLAASAEIAAKDLLALDYRDYAFVGFPLPLFWTKTREKAFCDAIHLNGRRCHVFDGKGKTGTRRLTALRAWIKTLPKPCGILAAFDGTAEELLNACTLEGIRVPEDFAVLGIDNNDEICEHTKPTLSSVYPDFEHAGFMCGELLDLQLRNPNLHLIAAVPFPGFDGEWEEDWRGRYRLLLSRAEYVKVLEPEPSGEAYRKRDEWMAAHSARVIAVYAGQPGDTRSMIRCARLCRVPVILLSG